MMLCLCDQADKLYYHCIKKKNAYVTNLQYFDSIICSETVAYISNFFSNYNFNF